MSVKVSAQVVAFSSCFSMFSAEWAVFSSVVYFVFLLSVVTVGNTLSAQCGALEKKTTHVYHKVRPHVHRDAQTFALSLRDRWLRDTLEAMEREGGASQEIVEGVVDIEVQESFRLSEEQVFMHGETVILSKEGDPQGNVAFRVQLPVSSLRFVSMDLVVDLPEDGENPQEGRFFRCC